MASIPESLHKTKSAIYDWYVQEEKKQSMRPYLGASIIGHHCQRYLWLSFRWALRQDFNDGRLLRLFETGHREEHRINHELRQIGCQVHEVDPKTNLQFEIEDCNGHFKGHLDAKACGLPDAPHAWHVLEYKTSGSKQFKELCDKKVKAAKPMHYAQMQVYMLKQNIDVAMYICVCKETDDLHIERIDLDYAFARSMIDRAQKIIDSNEPPLRCSEDPSWYQCKMCHMSALCHGTEAPLPNCRTCAHSSPVEKGEWKCEKYSCDIPLINQNHGCDSHRYIPILLEKFAAPCDANESSNWVEYKNTITGNTFRNDESMLSREIHSCKDKAMLGCSDMMKLKADMGAEVVG